MGLNTAKAGKPYILTNGSWLPVGDRALAGSPLSLRGSGAIPLQFYAGPVRPEKRVSVKAERWTRKVGLIYYPREKTGLTVKTALITKGFKLFLI